MFEIFFCFGNSATVFSCLHAFLVRSDPYWPHFRAKTNFYPRLPRNKKLAYFMVIKRLYFNEVRL